MRSRGLYILACLSVLLATAYSHALPTEGIVVVTTSNTETTTSEPTTEVVSEVTSEEPNAPIKMTEMDIRSEISLRYASTAVVTHVTNPASRAQEAHFRVLLPDTAFISGFVMTLDGKSYKAYVKEKEEAKNIYNEAVSQGFGAAHVVSKARDSNVFTVSVNVEPKSKAVFNLTYEELLTRHNSLYYHVVNIHPGGVVPKLSVTVHIKESQGITVLKVPEVRTGNEIDATLEDAQNQNAVITRSSKNREATITFTPDIEEQKRLIQIYKEKSKERHVHRYGFDTEDQTPRDGILGQFVVQYDVDRSKPNEILVNNGYFVHFFAPTSLPPLAKHVVFVLDTSGSMSGRKIKQLIEAMQTILGEMNKGDIFNIVQFESSVQILDVEAAYESSPVNYDNFYYRPASHVVPTLLRPVEATPENIAKAKLLVSRLRAGGGTNIATALAAAIALIQRGGITENITVVTTPKEDPKSSDAVESTSVASKSDNQEHVKVEDKESEINNDEKEPIIIFLTDGEPTVGESNPSRIIRIVVEMNYGKRKASVYCLSFGDDADRPFLRKMSLKNEGFSRHIYEASDASLQLRDFYRQISSPLVANVKFVYPPDQVKEGTLTKQKFRRFYAGSEAIVAGRIEDNVNELAPNVYGICGVGLDDVGRKRYEVSATATVENNPGFYLPLERLWAYLTIQQLLDERQVTDVTDDAEDSPAKKALALALKYEFVTTLTSLVVVKPNATSAVDAESVDKASASPLTTALMGFSPPRAPAFSSQFYPMAAPSYIIGGQAFQNSYPIPLSGMSDSLSDIRFTEDEADLQVNEDYGQTRALYGGTSYPHSLSKNGTSSIMRTAPWRRTFTSRLAPARRPLRPKQMLLSCDPLSCREPPADHGLSSVLTTPASIMTTSSPLDSYYLNEYTWLKPILNSSSDCINLQANGTQVDLNLTKDLAAPKTASGDEECSASTDGSKGLCVYLTRCKAAQNITVLIYSRTYCFVNGGFAGVCCPKNEVDKTH